MATTPYQFNQGNIAPRYQNLAPNGLTSVLPVGYKNPQLAPVYIGPNSSNSSGGNYNAGIEESQNQADANWNAAAQPTASTGVTATGTPGTPGSSTNPNADFSLLQQTKNPQVANATSGLLSANNQLANQQVTNFNDYLTQARNALATANSGLTADTNTFATAPGDLATQLNAINSGFANTANSNNANFTNTYQNLNNQNAATVAGDINNLNNLDAQYGTAATNVANNAYQAAMGGIKAYQAKSGTPISGGGDVAALAGNAYTGVMLPLQQQLAQMGIGQLTNYITPLQQTLYGNNVAQNNASQQWNQQTAQQIASMQTGSAQQVTALKAALAGRSVQESLAIMQSLGLPISVANQVLSGSVGNLGALSGVDLGNTFYGLAQQYTPGFTASTGYGMNTGLGSQPAGFSAGRISTNVQAGAQPLPTTVNPNAGTPPTATTPPANYPFQNPTPSAPGTVGTSPTPTGTWPDVSGWTYQPRGVTGPVPAGTSVNPLTNTYDYTPPTQLGVSPQFGPTNSAWSTGAANQTPWAWNSATGQWVPTVDPLNGQPLSPTGGIGADYASQ